LNSGRTLQGLETIDWKALVEEDIFLVDRTLQALETIDWIRQTSSTHSIGDIDGTSTPDLIIFGGDLNTEPGFIPYQVLTQFGSLVDKNGW